ncbi:MAG: flagellar hook-associated protein FlgK, partial [Gammaproteobacteria bacterium]|nr:flagellar hook-associated protein FlgK [Gammaproteobacteria bacterium]
AQMTAQLDGLFAANPVHAPSAFGFDLVMSGIAQAGDEYRIGFNSQGVGDNRNVLALALLAEERIVGDPPKTFAGVFAGLVQEIGAAASQVSVNKQAAAALLAQSESYRESVSGVNLDEEAANLIRYEQAYNASAQVISVARDMFNVLLRSVS